jgi:predicted nucleic-acid-binding Zn-ribbon protein
VSKIKKSNSIKATKKCIKCGANNWQRKVIGFTNAYRCSNCGYIFDWVDYTTVSKLDAPKITCGQLFRRKDEG